MTETLGILFQECESKTHDYENLCIDSQSFRMESLLIIATILRTGFVIISYGTKVPAGIFIPSMAVGSTFGRFLGLCKALLIHIQNFHYSQHCVTLGMYAFLGAAAAQVCVVVIMFELTGALTYILPTMITFMVTMLVGGLFVKDVLLNGFPFLDKEEYSFGVSTMRKHDLVMTASDTKLSQIVPVVQDKTGMTLLGYIGRVELKYAI
ncbi:13396_t:CDS:2, partial [Funneliformis geosporum]